LAGHPRRFDQQLEHFRPVLEIQFTGAPHGLKHLVPPHDDAHGACRWCPPAAQAVASCGLDPDSTCHALGERA
jgi:hypothetical protein